jgi:3-oxoacyl-[acyl-carrier-protein] synthase-1
VRKAVITGIGIVSCIGNNKEEVLQSLRDGRSGISAAPQYKEMGFRSQVYGKPDIDLEIAIDR